VDSDTASGSDVIRNARRRHVEEAQALLGVARLTGLDQLAVVVEVHRRPSEPPPLQAHPGRLLASQGEDRAAAAGEEAAREVAWSQLCAAKSALGELSRIKRVVKVLGMVNSAPGFADQPLVINGFSELLVEVFGENGRHARSAVGMAGLPGNVPVEVEVIFEIEG